MLGQLLHSFNPSRRMTPRNHPLDSVTEEAHTLTLLFPDNAYPPEHDILSPTIPSPDTAASLRTALGNDSSKAGVDLEHPRDVRILIAQGESGSLQELLLFDSRATSVNAKESPKARYLRPIKTDLPHQSPASPNARQQGRPPIISTIPEDAGRGVAGGSGPMGGAFAQRARFRRTSVSSTHSLPEENSQARQRDADDIVKTAMSCMFENATSSYKGTGNKIHIVPLESKPYDSSICSSSLGNDFGSPSHNRTHVRRPSSLSRSHTSGEIPMSPSRHRSTQEDFVFDHPRRRTVLVTRTFSVSWADTSVQIDDPFLSAQNGSSTEPSIDSQTGIKAHSAVSFEPQSLPRSFRTKYHRSPMYAITVVIQLPLASNDVSLEAPRYGSLLASSIRKSPHASLGSSFDSDRRSGFPILDVTFNDGPLSTSFSSDVDERVDLVGQHWDIISRSLTTIQYLTQNKILALLKPLPPTRRGVRLLHHALAMDDDIRQAAEYACLRIVRGIKIPRVRTGQGRWGIWREEARWLGQWAGGREENFFFFNLITAFLGTHTEWLGMLAPRSYRRLHREQQRLNPPEDFSVPGRTIVVSDDKMAARRLIFLLSAFLPSNYHARGDTSPLRPSTSASFRTYSQSPPSHTTFSRRESLRRTINRKDKGARARTTHHNSRGSLSSILLDPSDDKPGTATFTNVEGGTHSRQSSDARSIMKSKLSMTEHDPISRKSSATTTSTIIPSSAVPVPHFAYHRQNSAGAMPSYRPSSRESQASINLMNTLHRKDSDNATDSTSKWGSFRTFWSMGTRRESSTEYGDIMQSTDEGLAIKGVLAASMAHGKLQGMVDDGLEFESPCRKSQDLQVAFVDDDSKIPDMGESTPEQEVPKPIDIPLKMSVNESDGVIDVEVPFEGFGSPMQSPAVPGYHSGSSYGDSSLGNSSFLSMSPRKLEHPLNVGGWLEKLHPDFAVQATKSYPELLEDVKTAMSAEPNPPSLALQAELGQSEKWFDVCTTLIADTSTFTIKRLRLRRLILFNRAPNLPKVVTPGLHGLSRSQYGNPYMQAQTNPAPAISEHIVSEKFEEEDVMDFDGALADVIELVLGQSGTSSKTQSVTSSRSSSRRGRRDPHADEDQDDHSTHEIPRTQFKRAIFDALEHIAADVAKERKRQHAQGESWRTLDSIDSTLRAGINAWYDRMERNQVVEPRDIPNGLSPRHTRK